MLKSTLSRNYPPPTFTSILVPRSIVNRDDARSIPLEVHFYINHIHIPRKFKLTHYPLSHFLDAYAHAAVPLHEEQSPEVTMTLEVEHAAYIILDRAGHGEVAQN